MVPISTFSVNKLELLLVFVDSEHSGIQTENINHILITTLNAVRFLAKSIKPNFSVNMDLNKA